MKLEDVKKIAVIGSGAMGNGIAQVCAQAGIKAVMVDIKQEFIDKGMATINKSLDTLVSKGKMTAEKKAEVIGNLSTSLNNAEAVKDVQVIIEAVPEIMSLKKTVCAEICAAAPADALFASNTSTMSISEIATAGKNPERILGMHFFNPAPVMKGVEVIYAKQTSDANVDLLCELTKKIGKVPIKVLKDAPGFIVNRIGAPNQALISAVLDQGIKTDSIDTVMKALAGMPMGPFELADYVGIDVFYHTLKYYSETLSPEYKPGKKLQELLDSGKLGMKSGQGIYTWENGKAKIDASEQSKDFGPMEFLAIQINEAVRVYKEKIAASAADIDAGMVHCMRAFAGPFALGAGMEPAQLADTLNKLHTRFGLKIFKPEPEVVDGSFKQMK
ncbi:MAG TPA: 3-hydroxyacyl-CoA dehydrogenase family protein [Smithella sp.]|nr:3-hydroxyacyl-CoA dehydrogenase family protein [Smithella sp.]MDM7986783.1 3-hydroxyacyl-CoA dehydrogenase family protein [Smithella sp.]HNY50859.1 3-hydroxyacyl-CoA dehydrogenase family protein [Smithella sp.]HOG90809.1 3-hydroxyacyl-CoA dehydrogenase family protein [Smithella sp.]HOU50318.1 3-hydroxyacyl-CoA dehydrogenase family protein [Smithella sp.]